MLQNAREYVGAVPVQYMYSVLRGDENQCNLVNLFAPPPPICKEYALISSFCFVLFIYVYMLELGPRRLYRQAAPATVPRLCYFFMGNRRNRASKLVTVVKLVLVQ